MYRQRLCCIYFIAAISDDLIIYDITSSLDPSDSRLFLHLWPVLWKTSEKTNKKNGDNDEGTGKEYTSVPLCCDEMSDDNYT